VENEPRQGLAKKKGLACDTSGSENKLTESDLPSSSRSGPLRLSNNTFYHLWQSNALIFQPLLSLTIYLYQMYQLTKRSCCKDNFERLELRYQWLYDSDPRPAVLSVR